MPNWWKKIFGKNKSKNKKDDSDYCDPNTLSHLRRVASAVDVVRGNGPLVQSSPYTRAGQSMPSGLNLVATKNSNTAQPNKRFPRMGIRALLTSNVHQVNPSVSSTTLLDRMHKKSLPNGLDSISSSATHAQQESEVNNNNNETCSDTDEETNAKQAPLIRNRNKTPSKVVSPYSVFDLSILHSAARDENRNLLSSDESDHDYEEISEEPIYHTLEADTSPCSGMYVKNQNLNPSNSVKSLVSFDGSWPNAGEKLSIQPNPEELKHPLFQPLNSQETKKL